MNNTVRLYNEEYVQQIAKLKRMLRLSMNGVASESMENKGAIYKINYGVSYPRLKEIARQFPKDKVFAGMLWENNIREMKILATMLYPVEEFTEQDADNLVNSITQLEIAEQVCLNLFSHLSFAKKKSLEWIGKDEKLLKITGFLLISRLAARESWSNEELTYLIAIVNEELSNDSFLLTRIMFQTLRKLTEKDKIVATYLLTCLNTYTDERLTSIKEEIEEDLKLFSD